MKLIVITQRVDPDHTALGATVAMLRALAVRVDELVVLTLFAREAGLPGNVRVRSFAAPFRAARGARFVAALASELHPRPAAVLAHMSPIYAVLAAPVVRPLRIPVMLWFTHWRDSRLLHAAERVSSRVLTVDHVSFPFASPKVTPIGHGIDVTAIRCVERDGSGPLRMLALGRTSPAKGLDTIVAAMGLLPGAEVELELCGPSLTEEERRYREGLSRRLADPRVRLVEPVPRRDIGSAYAAVDVLVNNSRTGALDKVVYEAAASCLPVIVSNPGFEALVAGIEPELSFPVDDPVSLAQRIEALAAAPPEVRRRIGLELRHRVERGHSVEQWAERVVAAAR